MTDIDVVIPVRNRLATIGRTIEAVQAQSFDRFTLTLVDDGSDDGTTELLQQLAGPGVNYVRREGCGPSAARNAGANVGNGAWITFVDCDDEPKIEWLTTLMTEAGDADLVSCSADVVQGSVLHEERAPRGLGPAYNDITGAFWPGMFAVRRAVFESVGGYDEEIWFGENFELGMRISDKVARPGGVRATEASLITIRQPEGGVSQSSRADRLYSSAIIVLRKHAQRLARTPRLLASYHAIAGVNGLRLGLAAQARHHLRVAAFGAPCTPKYWARLMQASLRAGFRRRPRRENPLVLHVVSSDEAAITSGEPATAGGPCELHSCTLISREGQGASAAEHVVLRQPMSGMRFADQRSLLLLRRALVAIDPDIVTLPRGRLLVVALYSFRRRTRPG